MIKAKVWLSALAVCPLSCALASGFQSLEQSASGLGVAYAGSGAVAEDASTIFYNPAGMSRLAGSQVSLGLVGVRHNYEFNDGGSVGLFGDDGGHAGRWRLQPNAYFSWSLTPEWSLGLGVSSPNGVHIRYDNNWLGRPFSLETRLRSWNINPAVAYRASDKVSLGFGLNYQKLELESDWGNLHRSDADAAWGWNAGALFTLSPAMRVGIAYRSSLRFDLGASHPLLGVDGSGDLKTPGTLTLSVWQQIDPQWEAMGDLSYTHWKDVDGYDANGWRVAWGAAYSYNERWKSKFGIAYEHGPMRHTRWASLPDNHRLWLSLGGQYRFGKNAALDFGYAYQWMKSPDIDQHGQGLRLRGDYDGSGHVLGVQYSQGF